jgi:hypothetical protein
LSERTHLLCSATPVFTCQDHLMRCPQYVASHLGHAESKAAVQNDGAVERVPPMQLDGAVDAMSPSAVAPVPPLQLGDAIDLPGVTFSRGIPPVRSQTTLALDSSLLVCCHTSAASVPEPLVADHHCIFATIAGSQRLQLANRGLIAGACTLSIRDSGLQASYFLDVT